MAGTRTELRMLNAALADLPRIAPIAERIDTATTDRLAQWGRDHLASLSAERRAQLEGEWNS